MTSSKNEIKKSPAKRGNILLRLLGPGLVTGAADDDPSGIATYSQAGAQFGYGLLWTVFLTTPSSWRSRAGFTPHGFLVSVPAYSRFPEKKVGGPGTKPQARQF